MSRPRVYANPAERQKAYRRRLAENRLTPSEPPRRVRAQRCPSRPARLAALVDEAQALHDEYEEWLSRLPDSLAESTLATLLTEVVEQLQAVLDLLDGMQLPRGFFGRD